MNKIATSFMFVLFAIFASSCGNGPNGASSGGTSTEASYSISFLKLQDGDDPLFVGGINCEEGEFIKLPARPGRASAPASEDYFIAGVQSHFPSGSADKVFAGWCDSEPCELIGNLSHYPLSEMECPVEDIELTALMLEPTTNWAATNTGDLVIPNLVTSIGYAAFWNRSLTSVVIPDSVTSIEAEAFDSNNLTSVAIPDSVTSIGDWAFARNNLTSVVIPNSVTSPGYAAFHNNNLTSVVIPNSVTSIQEAAFNNNNLTSVVIPENVTIGNGNSMGTHGATFKTLYDGNGKLAGTYTYDSVEGWSRD